jgi:hypothetical protein
LGISTALTVKIGAGYRCRRDRVALVTRLFAIGDHVSRVCLTITTGSPRRARGVAIDACGSNFNVLLLLKIRSSSKHFFVLGFCHV